MKKSIYRIFTLQAFILLFSVHDLSAQVSYTVADSLIYERYISDFSDYKDKPVNDLVVETAKYFLDKPYVASTLDEGDKEQLIVNLREFDCIIFVEHCIALSETLKSDDNSFRNYCGNLQNIRYRNGIIEDYSSRLHYVKDWIAENEKRGILKNVTKDIGGTWIDKDVNFMSTHISSYRQLAESEEMQNKIKKIESRLNKNGGYYVILKDKLRDVLNLVQNGDIVFFSTTINGLDFSHTGIIYNDGKRPLTFIHASSDAKKTVIERKSLEEYVDKSGKCNGVAILRLIE
ncbi:MAG: N-acetylmuramoyl-L-alanine amidase-like domain-containing protein [Dysgonomonas sp.]